MKHRRTLAVTALVIANVAFGATVATGKPPASPNASCTGQSVSTYVPTGLVHPFGALVSEAVQSVKTPGIAFVKPEATASHDACPE